MIKPEELRIGNYVHEKGGEGLDETVVTLNTFKNWGQYNLEEWLDPIPLSEVWLERLGFDWVENESYCNGKQWTLQVSKKYEGETEINKDGTWFDGIGDYSWMPGSTKPKTMVVSSVCRGNYVCNSVAYVHQLQNLYYALTGKELTIK